MEATGGRQREGLAARRLFDSKPLTEQIFFGGGMAGFCRNSKKLQEEGGWVPLTTLLYPFDSFQVLVNPSSRLGGWGAGVVASPQAI